MVTPPHLHSLLILSLPAHNPCEFGQVSFFTSSGCACITQHHAYRSMTRLQAVCVLLGSVGQALRTGNHLSRSLPLAQSLLIHVANSSVWDGGRCAVTNVQIRAASMVSNDTNTWSVWHVANSCLTWACACACILLASPASLSRWLHEHTEPSVKRPSHGADQ